MGAKTRLCMLLARGPGSDAEEHTGMGKRLRIHRTSCNLLKWLATISDAQKDKDDINCEGNPRSSGDQQKFDESRADPESPVKSNLYLWPQHDTSGQKEFALSGWVLIYFS